MVEDRFLGTEATVLLKVLDKDYATNLLWLESSSTATIPQEASEPIGERASREEGNQQSK